MKETTINKIKEDEVFKLVPNGRVYVRGTYDRHYREYSYFDYDNVNREHFCHGNKKVLVDFEF